MSGLRTRFHSWLGLLPVLLLALAVGGCDDSTAPAVVKKPPAVVEPIEPRVPVPPAKPPLHSWQDCQASDQAWAAEVLLRLVGRRPFSHSEVVAMADAVAAIRRAQGQEASGNGAYRGDVPYVPAWNEARKVVARALLQDSRYAKRWSDFVLDALRVVRVETKSQAECYGPPLQEPYDDGALARFVRDHGPRDGLGKTWKLRDLVSSALVADDVSVLWRAHLFAMVSKPFTAANVGFLELERARRQDFGRVFDAAYLHRDFVCMSCHNSEYSVTANPDPQKNRAWPLPGRLERALFGAANGKHGPLEEAQYGPDALRAHAALRVADVVDKDKGQAPWGWNDKCGLLRDPTEPDPLGHDAFLGSVRGDTASVWDLERALHRGFERLASLGIQQDSAGDMDPDDALAWLVSQSIVQQVWADVMGQPFTVANYFPRTQVQRDTWLTLTEGFVRNRYSLRHLLVEVAVHPLFAQRAAEAGCGPQAYELPRLVNPWSNHDGDVAARNNGPGDLVAALPPRLLLRSLHTAMGWDPPAEFPVGDERTLQATLGVFLKDAEPGQRGLDFTGRLQLESAYGRCPKRTSGADFVDQVILKLGATPGATWRDALELVQDRLVGEPTLAADDEPALAALLGVALDSAPDLADTTAPTVADRLRLFCGALVASPQFVLQGMPVADSDHEPLLTFGPLQWQGRCAVVAELLATSRAPWTLTCGEGRNITATPRAL